MDFNTALRIRKDDPGVADVHVSSAGGDGKDRARSRWPKGKSGHWAFKKGETVALKADGESGQRGLLRYDDKTACTPFQYDKHALSDLRPDQVPRFFAALTDPDELETADVKLSDLHAMQNRVDPRKVEAIAASDEPANPPVIVRFQGKNYIADGHHRLTAAWMKGADCATVKIKNIGPRSNALKRKPLFDGEVRMPVTKLDKAQNRVFGLASVIHKDGKTVVDVQDDWTDEADLEEAFYDFVKSARMAGEMHEKMGVGDCIECMVFTKQKQEILGIDLGYVGAWVGFEVTPEVFAKVESGEYPAFSIGGSGIRLEGVDPA